MDVNEMKKLMIFRQVWQGTLSLKQASQIIGLTYRHTRRIWKKYCEEGERSLIHGNCGKPSNRAYDRHLKEDIIKKYRQYGKDLGPTRFVEELSEEGIIIDHETCRRWLLEYGIWQCESRKSMPSS